jgi:parallel beta-helix repeat protein
VDNSSQLRLFGSDRNVITDGSFSSSGGQNASLHDSHDNRLERNNFSNSNGGALSLLMSDHNTIRSNMTGSEAGGIELRYGSANLIEDNQGTGSFGGGPADGIDVLYADQTTLLANRVGAITVMSSTATAVRNNLVTETGSWQEGIFVAADSRQTTIDGNQVRGFGLDGIDVDAASTVLTNNTANDNGELGIEAVPGVIDGGGNRASGNTDPAQCLNVMCSAG